MDISDFFELIDILLDKNSPTGIYNASTGKGYSILQVFNEVAKYLNIKPSKPLVVPVGDDDVREVVLDPSKTEKIFGWKAKKKFSEVISNQLKLYDKYGIDSVFSHLTKPVELD